jgi:hypothetical protein
MAKWKDLIERCWKMIRAYLVGEQVHWDLNLGCLAGAYRASPNESTGFSPKLMCIGREIRIPEDIIFGHVNATNASKLYYDTSVLE